jgi:hypothetical protein
MSATLRHDDAYIHPNDNNNNSNGRNAPASAANADRLRTRLGPRDRRRLAKLLMEEMTAVDGFREPAIRDFKHRLDVFSRASGAPPAKPEVQMPAAFGAAAAAAPDAPVNFKDVLTEALGKLRNVDHLIKLFTDVAGAAQVEST